MNKYKVVNEDGTLYAEYEAKSEVGAYRKFKTSDGWMMRKRGDFWFQNSLPADVLATFEHTYQGRKFLKAG